MIVEYTVDWTTCYPASGQSTRFREHGVPGFISSKPLPPLPPLPCSLLEYSVLVLGFLNSMEPPKKAKTGGPKDQI